MRVQIHVIATIYTGWSYTELMEMPEDERIYWYEQSIEEHNRRREQEQEANARSQFSSYNL